MIYIEPSRLELLSDFSLLRRNIDSILISVGGACVVTAGGVNESHFNLTPHLLLLFPTLQKDPPRLPVKDPDEPEHVPPLPEPGVPIGRLAGRAGARRPVSVRGRLPALLPAHLLHLDGAGVGPHVHRPGQGLQHLHPQIHPQVLPRRLG